jgi:nicotinamidase-related amidase
VPIDLPALVAPGHTALVTQECQRGVIGDHSMLPALAEAAASGGIAVRIGALARAARAADIPVLHGVFHRRTDGRGANHNARLFMGTRRGERSDVMVAGSPSAEVVPEIGMEESDFVVPRYHGLSPMAGTSLDAILRNLDVTTIVGVGVSVNVAMTNFAFDAVNAGYQFVLPRDAVAGMPADYVEAVLQNTLAYVATVTTADEIIAAWS